MLPDEKLTIEGRSPDDPVTLRSRCCGSWRFLRDSVAPWRLVNEASGLSSPAARLAELPTPADPGPGTATLKRPEHDAHWTDA